MPFDSKNAPNLWLAPARVTAVDQENRLVDVSWLNAEGSKHNVIVTNDVGSYSFPKVNDIGLVIGDGIKYYFIGKIEYGYKDKIAGNTQDSQTGITIIAKLVKEGEIFLSNLVKKTWLSIPNSGDFSLMNGLNDGLRYFTDNRLLRLAGQTLSILGNGVELAIGSCVRTIPGIGQKVFPDESQKSTAPEFFAIIKKLGIKLARIHIGYVRDTMGLDENGSFGARLRALIEVCAGPVPVAVLKMDEIGNIELSSTAGIVMLDSNTNIKIGGLGAAHPAVFGDSLITWLNSHTHGTPAGPSGPPADPALPDMLSTKILLG